MSFPLPFQFFFLVSLLFLRVGKAEGFLKSPSCVFRGGAVPPYKFWNSIEFYETHKLYAIGGRPDAEIISFPKLDNNSMANERINEARTQVVPTIDTEVVYPWMRFDEGFFQKYKSRYRLAVYIVLDLFILFKSSRVLHVCCRTVDTSESRSEVPGKFWNVVLEINSLSDRVRN
jgi:hypothetical protein